MSSIHLSRSEPTGGPHKPRSRVNSLSIWSQSSIVYSFMWSLLYTRAHTQHNEQLRIILLTDRRTDWPTDRLPGRQIDRTTETILLPPCFAHVKYKHNHHKLKQQHVALTGRNRTGPPCSVSCPTAFTPGPATANRPRARHPASPSAGSVTDDDDRWQTPASKTTLAH